MKPLFTATFSVAFVAYIVPCIASFIPGFDISLLARPSFVLSAAWFLLLAVTLFRCRWRGLWALIALPLVIFWPCFFSLLSACRQNVNNCP
jgi:hypothetical protein